MNMPSATQGAQAVCAAEGGRPDELTHLFKGKQSTCLIPLLLAHVPKASYEDNYSD